MSDCDDHIQVRRIFVLTQYHIPDSEYQKTVPFLQKNSHVNEY